LSSKNEQFFSQITTVPLIKMIGFIPRAKVKDSNPYSREETQFPTHTTGLTNGRKFVI